MSTTVENFIERTTPAHKRSELHQHAETITRLKRAGYSWQQVADFLAHTTGRKFHRNTLLTWWNRQRTSQTTTSLIETHSSPHRLTAGLRATKAGAPMGALDSLINECQQDVPGFPPRERVRG